MTKLLEQAIKAVRKLTPDEQDALARVMLSCAQDDDADDGEEIDPSHLAAIDRGLDDLKNGRIATPEEVDSAFRAFRK